MDQSTSPPSFDTEEYYEVERIVDHGCNEVGMWFRVRWKGYGPDSDTWEPENNFMKPSFVRKYLKKVAKEAAARQKSGKASQSPEKDETTTTVSAVNEALGQGKVKSDSNNNDSVDQHSQDLAPYPPTIDTNMIFRRAIGKWPRYSTIVSRIWAPRSCW